jgi:hypothetical protein
MLVAMQDRMDVDAWPAVADPACPTEPIFLTALAVVSGMLEDAHTKGELLAAIQHADALVHCGVIPCGEVDQAMAEVFEQLKKSAAEFGRRVPHEMN